MRYTCLISMMLNTTCPLLVSSCANEKALHSYHGHSRAHPTVTWQRADAAQQFPGVGVCATNNMRPDGIDSDERGPHLCMWTLW